MDIPSIDYILDEAAKNNMAIWQVVLKEEQAESGMSEEDIRARLLGCRFGSEPLAQALDASDKPQTREVAAFIRAQAL